MTQALREKIEAAIDAKILCSDWTANQLADELMRIVAAELKPVAWLYEDVFVGHSRGLPKYENVLSPSRLDHSYENRNGAYVKGVPLVAAIVQSSQQREQP